MKKPTKKLRKLLNWYKNEIVIRPYTQEDSRILDCIEIIIERLTNEKHP